ncbi:hypothetical protein HW555_011582 [Spodoptera exigua]|uniref:hydroxymethylbilane synthase n=1 Tax=Spodoptera exigua TaxID=7107 RepID=A0A835L0F6_SPOEX|nr:hypothetical protein HW555_011582 [Spodoptera exigua]
MESEAKNVVRVGSRKSELALIQTNYVIDCLKKVHPEKEFTVVTMTTLGDRILDVSLPKIGEKEDPRDALVLREDFKDHTLATLPEGSVIGTSSLRRTAQLRGSYPQLSVADVRGNLNTRLRKLDTSGQYAALLLASAGLQRMGWKDRISKILPCADMKYAVGQGALAVECRSDNTNILNMLAPFNHPETYCRILAERSFPKDIGFVFHETIAIYSCALCVSGGCSAPVGVSTTLKPVDSQFRLSLTGAVWSMDGKTKLDHTLQQTFAQIRRTQKHKLSPTEESECKKVKTDNGESKNEILNPNEVLKDETVGKSVNQDKEDESDNRIFCGLTINTSIPIDVIIKCDNLGKDVANALIEKGALDVMKVTQDIIRSSTVGKSS